MSDTTVNDVVSVDSLEAFVPLLVQWHDLRISRLNHLLDTPEGVEVDMDGQAPLVLEGLALQGFKLGINIALHQLGKLPLVIDSEVTSDA